MLEKQLERYTINSGSTIRQAMQSINDNWREVTLVKTDDGRIIGTVTDGDIRRGLLRGLTMESPATEVMNREFTSVGPEMNRATVMDLMRARSIVQIPVVDKDMHLLAIHFLQDLIGNVPRPNVAVIMAGGKGVRLRPVTETIPKPMVPVAGRPILERVILHLVGFGIKKIYVAINYMGEMIEEHFGDGSSLGCELHYLKENRSLGTGGPLSLLSYAGSHPLVVMNGDLITQANIGSMLEFHQSQGCAATVGISIYPLHIPFGVVKKQGNRLLQLNEKPTEHFFINTGIYVLNPSVLTFVPKDEEFPLTSLIQNLLEKNMPVGTFLIEEEWIDIGRQKDLKKANGIIDE